MVQRDTFPRPTGRGPIELERCRDSADNGCMVIPGRVHNGVVILEGGHALPEGAAVSVRYPAPNGSRPAVEKRRIQVPLVQTNQPGSVHLTSERIAEILDEEDASPRR
jgi:hypothetical protein